MQNYLSQVLKTLLVASLTISTTVLAEEAPKVMPDKSDTECSTEDLNLMPISEGESEVSYVSGGVCADDAELMKGIAHQFPLEIVLVEKSDEYEKENYIADVRVAITDVKKEKKYLDVYTEGPFLLVNIPDGRYLITAEYTGVSKAYKVNIVNDKHKRVVFLWSMQTESE